MRLSIRFFAAAVLLLTLAGCPNRQAIHAATMARNEIEALRPGQGYRVHDTTAQAGPTWKYRVELRNSTPYVYFVSVEYPTRSSLQGEVVGVMRMKVRTQ